MVTVSPWHITTVTHPSTDALFPTQPANCGLTVLRATNYLRNTSPSHSFGSGRQSKGTIKKFVPFDCRKVVLIVKNAMRPFVFTQGDSLIVILSKAKNLKKSQLNSSSLSFLRMPTPPTHPQNCRDNSYIIHLHKLTKSHSNHSLILYRKEIIP